MACLKVVALLVLVGMAFGEFKFPDPCSLHDMECMKLSHEIFLKTIAKGLPKYDVKPIDPMDVHDVVVPISDDLSHSFTHLKIIGIQNEKISNFTVHKDGNFLTYNGRDKLSIEGSATSKHLKLGDSLTGTFKLSVDAFVNLRMEYDVRTDDEGVKRMFFGKDTYTCEASEVTYTLDPKKLEASHSGKDHQDELNKKIACDLILAGYPTIIENVKKLAVDGLPISTIFTDF